MDGNYYVINFILECPILRRPRVVNFADVVKVKVILINPFVPNAPFLYPLKTSLKVFWRFQGVEKVCIGNLWIKTIFDDDDDDDDDELFLWYGWPTKGVALFPAGTIVRDPHHCESPTRREQDLSLRRPWVQALVNEVVQ